MPLQNRVTPFGEIVADPAYGDVMGNRGILHDGSQSLGVNRWKTKAWIVCVLSFKNRRRDIMAPGHYTELFFRDEATALAAGHRPCAECRRNAFVMFADAWARAHDLTARPTAGDMDAVLHASRVEASSRAQVHHRRNAASLPDGVFVAIDNEAFLVQERQFLKWTPRGYADAIDRPTGNVTVLTPAPTVAVLASGYLADVHASARG